MMKGKKLLLNLLAAFVPAAAALCFILVRTLGTASGAEALYAQAAAAVEAGDYGQAEEVFAQMEAEYPAYLPQYELQAERYIREGDSSPSPCTMQ